MIEVAACDMPPKLHPVSELFLNHYIDGTMSIWEFLRFFSLPNSDYISRGRCIVNWLAPIGMS